jgi:hypothetical protein
LSVSKIFTFVDQTIELMFNSEEANRKLLQLLSAFSKRLINPNISRILLFNSQAQ